MKDIIIEKNSKKVLDNFQDLFVARNEIIKHASKKINTSEDEINHLSQILHPNKIEVVVKKIVEENSLTKSFYFTTEDGSSFPPFIPGSYITLEIHIDNRIYKRPYSISSNPSHLNEYRITVKKEGIVSKYLFNECKENDKFTLYGPFGHFHYNSLRDSNEVIFLAGGSGITPMKPMIEDLLIHKRVSKIDLIYGTKTVNDILWKKEFDELTKKYKNFHIIYLLSEEKRDDYSYGIIDESLLRKLEPMNKTIFISGPTEMYKSLNELLKKLNIPNKYIRHEIYTNIPENLGTKEYKLVIRRNNEKITIPCYENKTLVQSMEENHIDAPVHCTVGVCGFCKSKLIQGTVKTENSCLRKKDQELKYIHPCVTYPLSDIEIELPF